MTKISRSLVIKKLPRSSMKGVALSASARKAIVQKARAAVQVKTVAKLRRKDTATGSGHVVLAPKHRAA